jgi:hypothetical protein
MWLAAEIQLWAFRKESQHYLGAKVGFRTQKLKTTFRSTNQAHFLRECDIMNLDLDMLRRSALLF